MTNVKPNYLNYHKYSSAKYDKDIVNSIPHHKTIHGKIAQLIRKTYSRQANLNILELGPGTGITTKLFKILLPLANFDVIDFSKHMLSNAKQRLGTKNIQYVFGDYSKVPFAKKYDIVVSVIGIHHQENHNKQKLFKKIYFTLKPNGIFIFGDLITHKNKITAAYNNALHFHHLVEHASDAKTLAEWAYHHQFLNILAPIEDQVAWLEQAGFKVKILYKKTNTALLVCKK